MSTLEEALEANREAVRGLVAAGERSGARWSVPRAEGKWSPAQVTEHVARALEESANLVAGRPSKFPKLPFFLRPLARGLLLHRVIRTGRFPKARTNRPMDPERGPDTPAEGRARVEVAAAAFDRACSESTTDCLESDTFGVISLVDYARFQAVHTRHHTVQIPDPH